MATGEIDLDDHCGLGLAEWLQNEEVAGFQKSMEERIVRFLFNRHPDAQFVQAIQMLVWIGSHCRERAALQREIIALNEGSLIFCGLGKSLWQTSCKIGRFVADHKLEILVGAALLITGVGIAAAAGYTCSVAVGGVVLAGTGSIFTKEESPKGYIPSVPSSKEEIALVGQSPFPPLPKLEFPSSDTEVLVTADGIWANGQFFSNQDLMQRSIFADGLLTQKVLPEKWNPIPPLKREKADISAYYEFELNPVIPLREPQPPKSNTFTVNGKQHGNCCISWINGMNNSLQESKESATYIQTLSGGHTVSGIYNCTNTPIVDALEAALLNYQGNSPNTAQLLRNEWKKFHEENRDRPNAKLLQICHSQGTIDVKNALIGSSLEIRDRVIVAAFAPAAVVPKRLCFQSYNYVSEKDFIYKLEPLLPPQVVSLTMDDVLIPTFGEEMGDRAEVIILAPHPGAKGIDHEFQSATYQPPLEKVIAIYRRNKGEYLPEDKGKLE